MFPDVGCRCLLLAYVSGFSSREKPSLFLDRCLSIKTAIAEGWDFGKAYTLIDIPVKSNWYIDK